MLLSWFYEVFPRFSIDLCVFSDNSLLFFGYISRFSLIFRLWEKDNGNHKRDYSCGEEMDAKLTDKICYKGLTHFLVEDKADALVGDEMEEEIVDNKNYRRGDK